MRESLPPPQDLLQSWAPPSFERGTWLTVSQTSVFHDRPGRVGAFARPGWGLHLGGAGRGPSACPPSCLPSWDKC